ncbi:MAG TPA: ABC transporter permease [Candidatus Korarchaeota archaeon]|nr:ABC transporter permease [Candidatus Korarchaeota archaeon]
MRILNYLVMRLFYALVVLTVALLISAIVFNKLSDQQLRSLIRELVKAELQQNPELLRTLQKNRTALKVWMDERTKIYLSQYGLDKPFWYRVFKRVYQQLKLDFGKSSTMISAGGSSDVSKIILEALPRTVLLFTTGTIFVILIGLFLGLKAAQSAGSMLDKSISIFALVSYSLPMWWTGMLFIIIFAYYLKIFPSGGMMSAPPPETLLARVADILYHLALPVMTYVFVVFGGWSYTTRNVVLNQLQEDFVMAARAKGIPERKVLYGHVLRASAPPIVTMIVGSLLGSLGGAMISEIVFNWPGMGRLYWNALSHFDIPVLMGNTTISMMLFLGSLIFTDLVYALLDPRVRIGAMGVRR